MMVDYFEGAFLCCWKLFVVIFHIFHLKADRRYVQRHGGLTVICVTCYILIAHMLSSHCQHGMITIYS